MLLGDDAAGWCYDCFLTFTTLNQLSMMTAELLTMVTTTSATAAWVSSRTSIVINITLTEVSHLHNHIELDVK